MIVAIDVHYRPDGSATAAVLCFSSWESPEAVEELVLEIEEVAQYVPGQKRAARQRRPFCLITSRR